MVNIYVFAVMVCLNFCLALFRSRIKRLGYKSGRSEHWTELPKKRLSYYNEVVDYVILHLKMDEWVIIVFGFVVLEFDFIHLLLNNRLVKEIQMLFNELFFVQVIQSALVFANSAFLLIAVCIFVVRRYDWWTKVRMRSYFSFNRLINPKKN